MDNLKINIVNVEYNITFLIHLNSKKLQLW
jgi:hypothetical protein